MVTTLTARWAAFDRRPVARQVARFVVVGLGNTALTMATIYLLREGLGASVAVASAIGFIVGMIQGFLLSRLWTFAGVDHATPVALQVVGFVVVNLICGAIFTRSNVWLSGHLPLLVASLASAAVIMPISFALNRWGVFRSRTA